MSYTFCNYMLDALHDLRDYEEDPATRQSLFAAINAFVDEHRRHSGLEPVLATRVIDMLSDVDDEEEINSVVAGPCQQVPSSVLETSHQASIDIANAVMDDLGLDSLKKYSEYPNSATPPRHPH